MNSSAALSALAAVIVGVVAAAIIAGLLVRHHHRRTSDARELAATLSSHVRAWQRYCAQLQEGGSASINAIVAAPAPPPAIAPEATLVRHASAIQTRSFPALHTRMRMVVLLHGMMSRALFVTDFDPARQGTLQTLCKQLEWEVDLLLGEMNWPALASARSRAAAVTQDPAVKPRRSASATSGTSGASGKRPDALLHHFADELQSPFVRLGGGPPR